MGDQEGLRIANAFQKDIWVRVISDDITEFSNNSERKGEANIGTGQTSLNLGKYDYKKTSIDGATAKVETKIEEGFSKLAKFEENTINPPNFIGADSDKARVYLTVFYLDEEEKKVILSDNVPYKRGYSFIVTAKGGIVESMNETNIWLDKNGDNHKTQSRKNKINVWLKNLREIATTMECRTREDKEKITSDVKEISASYRKLEWRTNRVIRDVRIYGEDIVKAIELLLQVVSDKTVKDAIDELQWEMDKTKDLKDSLKEVTENSIQLLSDIENFEAGVEQLVNKVGEWESCLDVIRSLITSVPDFTQRSSKKAKAQSYSSLNGIRNNVDKIESQLDEIINDLCNIESKFAETEKAKDKAVELTPEHTKFEEGLVQKAKELVKVCNEFLVKGCNEFLEEALIKDSGL